MFNTVRADVSTTYQFVQAAVFEHRKSTSLPAYLWTHVFSNSCEKVLDARVEEEEGQKMLTRQSGFKWPHGVLAGRPLQEHGLPCSPCTGRLIGSGYYDMDVQFAEQQADPGQVAHFVDFSKPMNSDGWISSFEFDAAFGPDAAVVVSVWRFENNGDEDPVIRPQRPPARISLDLVEVTSGSYDPPALLVSLCAQYCFVV